MNNIFIDVDYAQIYKHGQKIGGDVFLLSRNPENNQIVSTLSDGLGSGVKANVLASLTAHSKPLCEDNHGHASCL